MELCCGLVIMQPMVTRNDVAEGVETSSSMRKWNFCFWYGPHLSDLVFCWWYGPHLSDIVETGLAFLLALLDMSCNNVTTLSLLSHIIPCGLVAFVFTSRVKLAKNMHTVLIIYCIVVIFWLNIWCLHEFLFQFCILFLTSSCCTYEHVDVAN